MTRKTLNIGLIGSGFMGQAHADAFRRAAMLYKDLPAIPQLTRPAVARRQDRQGGLLRKAHQPRLPPDATGRGRGLGGKHPLPHGFPAALRQ